MDLAPIFEEELSFEELMAPSAEFCFLQDAKYYVQDAPVQVAHSNSGPLSDAVEGPDIAAQQPQLDHFRTSDAIAEQVATDDSIVAEPPTNLYGQHPGVSPLHCGMNRNMPANTIMYPADEYLFDGMSRDVEKPKRENSLMLEHSESTYTNDNLFSSHEPQSTSFSSETRDAFAVQVQGVNYPCETGMIPSVVDHGAEALAAAAAKNKLLAQSRPNETPNLVMSSENNEHSSPRRPNAGSSRRRSSKGPKPKLHQRTEPYTDVEMETKRKNAIKAHKNRLRAKQEKETMEAEIARLKKLVQEKEDIILSLREERRVEKANRIRVLQEELATLTGSYNAL